MASVQRHPHWLPLSWCQHILSGSFLFPHTVQPWSPANRQPGIPVKAPHGHQNPSCSPSRAQTTRLSSHCASMRCRSLLGIIRYTVIIIIMCTAEATILSNNHCYSEVIIAASKLKMKANSMSAAPPTPTHSPQHKLYTQSAPWPPAILD